MASVVNARRLTGGILAMLATAAPVWFGTGLDPFWPLMWFAAVPVLVFAVDASAWGAALVAGLAMMLGVLNLWGLLHGVLKAPLGMIAPLYIVEGVALALAALLFRALMQRRAYWSALLAYPALWVSFEWFLNFAAPHGTAGSLAYSQLRFLPFLQLASVTGPWGMTFVLCAFAASVAIAICLRSRAPAQGYRILATTAAGVIAVLAFGTVRLLMPATGIAVKVGLVSSDGPNEDVADAGAPATRLFQAYAPVIERLAEQGAAVVVLPEKTSVVLEPDVRAVDAEFQALAERAHVRIAAGVLRIVPAHAPAPVLRYNEVRLYTPGAPVEHYDKEHMLPPFESNLTPGTALTLVPASGGAGTWGLAICKDMDFTQLSRRYGASGAGLMLVPGWDFFLDWIQHGHMAVMRGVESGFSIARSAKGGTLFVSDDRGRIMGEIKSDAAPFSSLLVSVGQTHDRTLFLLLGDWFAWLAVTILALCLVQLVRQPLLASAAYPM